MSDDSKKGNKGLKINNEKSTVAAPTSPNTDAFQQQAAEAANRLGEYKKRSWDLGVKFKGLIESSVLPENKSPLIKDLETETLAQLAQLANDINNDESQPEGTGSIALAQLIMKMLLLQKDICSKQRFELETLRRTVDELRANVEDLQSELGRLDTKINAV